MMFNNQDRSLLSTPPFASFFIAGFECSSHKLRSGTRLNLLRSTQHYQLASKDFARLRSANISTIRTGVNWHSIEIHPYQYDFTELRQYLSSVKKYEIQAIWDLCHYGYPDDLDIFSAEFVDRFVAFARAAAQVIVQETDSTLFICPINEVSFWAWAGGDAGYLNPFFNHRSFELKKQLVRASLEAISAIREIVPTVRVTAIDPIISIIPGNDHPEHIADAKGHHLSQYQTWDMLCGDLCPELGGNPAMLDIIGVNYYNDNQWIHGGPIIYANDAGHRPFSALVRNVYERYQRPIFIAETGIEGDGRPAWLRYISNEVQQLLAENIPIEGICLYPILDYHGWDDDRHCPSGLWGLANVYGERDLYTPLAEELRTQQQRLASSVFEVVL